MLRKTKEKLKIHWANGTVRVLTQYVRQACVVIGEHAEFLDFHAMKLPKYEAILGKPWLDRWNPHVNWKNNELQWKVGSRVIKLTGLQDPNTTAILSSFFSSGSYVEEISTQRT